MKGYSDSWPFTHNDNSGNIRDGIQATVNPDAAEENFSWTDDEVKLLLVVVRAYSSQKDYEGLEWKGQK